MTDMMSAIIISQSIAELEGGKGLTNSGMTAPPSTSASSRDPTCGPWAPSPVVDGFKLGLSVRRPKSVVMMTTFHNSPPPTVSRP
jgi:hypothetical protein